MAKKNEFLSKKERKYYSRLLAAKLEEMGVQDDVTFQAFQTRDGKPVTRKYVDHTGKTVFEGPVGKLTNVHRNLIRRLRKMPREAVLGFLAVKMPANKEASDEQQVE